MPPRRSPAAKSAQPACPCALIPPQRLNCAHARTARVATQDGLAAVRAFQMHTCAHCPSCDTRWTTSCTGVSTARMRALPGLRRKMDWQLYRRLNCTHARTARVATQNGLAAVRAFQLRALPALGLRCALIRCTYRISALSSAMPAPPASRRAPAARRA